MPASRCMTNKCKLCPALIQGGSWSSRDGRITKKIEGDLNCNSDHLFFIADCKKCNWAMASFTISPLHRMYGFSLKKSKTSKDNVGALALHMRTCNTTNIRILPIMVHQRQNTSMSRKGTNPNEFPCSTRPTIVSIQGVTLELLENFNTPLPKELAHEQYENSVLCNNKYSYVGLSRPTLNNLRKDNLDLRNKVVELESTIKASSRKGLHQVLPTSRTGYCGKFKIEPVTINLEDLDSNSTPGAQQTIDRGAQQTPDKEMVPTKEQTEEEEDDDNYDDMEDGEYQYESTPKENSNIGIQQRLLIKRSGDEFEYRLWQWTPKQNQAPRRTKKTGRKTPYSRAPDKPRWVQVTKSQTAPDANGFKGSLSDKEKALTRAMSKTYSSIHQIERLKEYNPWTKKAMDMMDSIRITGGPLLGKDSTTT
ncbi:DgyrCDS14951 [Dimorphilus gyrociliatus]|uniref:DgyrCDS14951 n=1 Tax=Dimorphilus gyrociliatus TaxID=2664684 RepID=A0A7I8WFR1_9ANNE|nr:DgyrCDS14951 [Dimorphilus gyrociliatus]